MCARPCKRTLYAYFANKYSVSPLANIPHAMNSKNPIASSFLLVSPPLGLISVVNTPRTPAEFRLDTSPHRIRFACHVAIVIRWPKPSNLSSNGVRSLPVADLRLLLHIAPGTQRGQTSHAVTYPDSGGSGPDVSRMVALRQFKRHGGLHLSFTVT